MELHAGSRHSGVLEVHGLNSGLDKVCSLAGVMYLSPTYTSTSCNTMPTLLWDGFACHGRSPSGKPNYPERQMTAARGQCKRKQGNTILVYYPFVF